MVHAKKFLMALAISSAVCSHAEFKAFSTGAVAHHANEQKSVVPLLSTRQDIVSDAMKKINEELAKIVGKAHIVSRTYQIKDHKPISATTKINYADYRKHATYTQETFQHGDHLVADQVVQVVYRLDDKNYVHVVEKCPKDQKKSLKQKKIKLSNATHVKAG